MSALMVILTVAAAFCAFLNFQQQSKYRLTDDGVTWLDRDGQIQAVDVRPSSPGEKAGIRTGDRLISIGGLPLERAVQVVQVLNGPSLGPWKRPTYTVRRGGVEVPLPLILVPVTPPPALYYQYLVGVAYLLIGLFVYFRRGSAPKALHFYLLCLLSFVLSTFHYTGKLNRFDEVVYWGNVTAGLFAPTVFLHFCLTFPSRHRRRPWEPLVYAPAAVLLLAHVGVALGHLRSALTPLEARWLLDRGWMLYLCLTYLLGAGVLSVLYRRATDPVLRQQVRWLRNGALVGVLPFTLLYGLPYAWGAVPTLWMQLAVLSLPVVPLTWAYAIVRYRLMDVDVIFQQGYVYTLATVTVLGVVYGLFFSIGKFDEISPSAVVALILLATFVFQPIRNWVQEQLDRYFFYRERYDARRTLLTFARQLGAEPELDPMLHSVGERLLATLMVPRVAFFLWDEGEGRFALRSSDSLPGAPLPDAASEPLDLSFLSTQPERPYYFFEHTRVQWDVVSQEMPASVRRTIAHLGLTYFLPCVVRGRTIAYVGLSRLSKGDFLSQDDIELLLTLCDYVGMAVENSRLYSSLQRKAEEFERLKEFSENIVESVNVGILAVDLQNRVGSWNGPMERLTGLPREAALGRRLHELFPDELCAQFDVARPDSGIYHADKLRVTVEVLRARTAHASAGTGTAGEADGGVLERTVNLAVAPLFSKESERIGRLIILDDVTDRADLERRLVQADKLSSIGLLAAGVAHEVNTPLAVISTYAQMLAKQVNGDTQKAQLLEKIAKQTFRASEIVNSLLNFSRTGPTTFAELSLNRLLRETVSLIQHQLDRARVKVEWDLDESLPPVQGNSGKLQQVFLNLCLNARDAMEGGGVLTLRTCASGGTARVDIADTGHGIPPEHLARIYDPFFTTKGSKKGTGLGLSITYGIVQEHAGSIDVKTAPGQGTKFLLEFPLVRKPVAA